MENATVSSHAHFWGPCLIPIAVNLWLISSTVYNFALAYAICALLRYRRKIQAVPVVGAAGGANLIGSLLPLINAMITGPSNDDSSSSTATKPIPSARSNLSDVDWEQINRVLEPLAPSPSSTTTNEEPASTPPEGEQQAQPLSSSTTRMMDEALKGLLDPANIANLVNQTMAAGFGGKRSHISRRMAKPKST